MALGRASRRRAVSLEEAAAPGAERCPACGEPLFVWIETEGWGPREDQIVERCESCGLVVDPAPAPDPAAAAAELFGPGGGSNGHPGGPVTVRAANAASVQAWLGAENWAALRPGERALKPSPRAARLLAERRGLKVTRIRFVAAAGMAGMWQTLLNLLTFHRDFAAQATSGALRPGRGKALIAVLVEGGAVLARRGGMIEITAEPS